LEVHEVADFARTLAGRASRLAQAVGVADGGVAQINCPCPTEIAWGVSGSVNRAELIWIYCRRRRRETSPPSPSTWP
jgi:hypothetical protein